MDKKAMKKAFKEKAMNDFKESLPIKDIEFLPLFEFLENELDENDCSGDFALLEKYCKEKKIDFSTLSAWLREHGGFCDCEILGNIEERFYYLTKNEMRYEKAEIGKQTRLNNLTTDFGFSIDNIPNPWVLKSIFLNGVVSYEFQIGKKSYFKTSLVKNFPIEKLADDSFLQNYWMVRTELDFDLEFVINRAKILDFELVLVKTMYMPIFLFVYHPKLKWCLIMRTEVQRLNNDLKALEDLLKMVSVLHN